MRAYGLAARPEAELDHRSDDVLRRDGIVRCEARLDITQQSLREEGIVVGGSVANLHRFPHRLGDAAPGRIDQLARGRSCDEDPREIEQQRRVLVAARIEPGERGEKFQTAHIRIADQIEGGIGRNEAMLAERSQQVLAAKPDRGLYLRHRGHADRLCDGLGLRMIQLQRVEQACHRSANGRPIRIVGVAGLNQRVAQVHQPRLVPQLGKTRAPEQRPQGDIIQSCPVELREMGITATVVSQERIADVIERGAILGCRQGAIGCAGKVLDSHKELFPVRAAPVAQAHPYRAVEGNAQVIEKLHE